MRETLLTLLADKSLFFGDFLLASGKRSPYYFDCRKATLDIEGQALVAGLMMDRIARLERRPDAVGGLSMGADPVVSSILAEAYHRGFRLQGFYVRKTPKHHGTQSRIEGNLRRGERVVIVEDVVTTGGSVLSAIEAVEAEQCPVVHVLAIVDREEGGGEELRRRGYPLTSIFRFQEILDRARP